MNTIGDHDYVLSVVSDTYLKSKACMYVISGVLKDHHYKSKLIFVVLSEPERDFYQDHAPEKIGADIYGGAISRINYISFWEEQYNKLDECIKELGNEESKKEVIDDLQVIGQICRKDIGDFLQFLSEENGKNFKELYETEFEDLIQFISEPLQLQKNEYKKYIDSKLEEMYLRFPHNTKIVGSFAKFLFRLSQNEDEHVVTFVIDYLEKIYNEHSCLDVALMLAMSLTNLSVRQNGEEIQKTELRVKSLYCEYSDCLEMTVVYTKCLVNCTRDDETIAQTAIMQLRELYNQYKENVEIASNYASGLLNICLSQKSKEITNIVACIEQIYQHYPGESEIIITYAKSLKIQSGMQNISDAVLTVKHVEKLYMKNSNIMDLAIVYMQCLVNLISKDPGQKINDLFSCIEQLYNQYPDEPKIISGYAMGLYNYQQKQELENTLKCVKRMESLYNEHPNVAETFLGLARCLVDLSVKQKKEAERLYIVARLEYLLSKHPHEDVAIGYAIGLYNLSLKQDEDGLRSTMARFDELYKCYPNNERIASEFASFRDNIYSKIEF